jgi:EAL domain-containing protein (putative c-di-GMP-specific phosphodiesterase class I)
VAEALAPKKRRAILCIISLFALFISVAQAQPLATPETTPVVTTPAPSEPAAVQASAMPGEREQEANPYGRLLPGLLLGLLLSIGAYHIGRQVYDSAPGSRGASALLVSGFVYEYVAFGLHEPMLGQGRPAQIFVSLSALGVALAGLAFLAGFLTLKKRDGPASAVTHILMGVTVLWAVIAPLKPQFAQHAADGMLAAVLLWSLGATLIYARQGDTRAAYLLPGLIVLAATLVGAGLLLIVPGLSKAIFVPILHGGFVIGLLVIAFAVTNAWTEPVSTYVALAKTAPAAPEPAAFPRESVPPVSRNASPPASGARKAKSGAPAKDRQLGKALAVSGYGLWDWNISARRISMSTEAEAMLGLEKGFFDGSEESFLAAIAETDRARLRTEIAERVAQGEGAFSLAFSVEKKGERRALCLQGSCFANWEGAIVRCVGLLREVYDEDPAPERAAPAVPAPAVAPSPQPALTVSSPPTMTAPLSDASAEPSDFSPKITSPAPGAGETVSEAEAAPPALSAADLRHAFEHEELEPHYRPIISLADRRVAGFEAELHWRHPACGLIKPTEFTDMAEREGLAGALLKYALALASMQLYQWQTFFPLAHALFVNVPIRESKSFGPELVAHIKAALTAASLAPATLRLEITERALLDNPSQSSELLGQLKRAGAGIVLEGDVASTSTLSTLERFPLNAVKVSCPGLAIDNAQDMKTLRAIIERARRLHMEVIVSGVESDEQVKGLKVLACEYAQGHCFGAPLPVHEAQSLVAHFWSG